MMKKGLGPAWSEEQKAAGEQSRKAWEEFFSMSEADKNQTGPSFPGFEEGAKIAQVLRRHESELLRYPNVVGVAQGTRTKGGKPTGEACIVVYVEKKIPRDQLEESAILPGEIEGIPVDVVGVGKLEAL